MLIVVVLLQYLRGYDSRVSDVNEITYNNIIKYHFEKA